MFQHKAIVSDVQQNIEQERDHRLKFEIQHLLVAPCTLGKPHQDEKNLLLWVQVVCNVKDTIDLQNTYK